MTKKEKSQQTLLTDIPLHSIIIFDMKIDNDSMIIDSMHLDFLNPYRQAAYEKYKHHGAMRVKKAIHLMRTPKYYGRPSSIEIVRVARAAQLPTSIIQQIWKEI